MGYTSRLKETRLGLKYMTYGFYAYTLLTFIAGLIYYSWSYNPTSDPTLAVCFPALLGLAGIILFLMGLLKIYGGTSNMISSSHDMKMKIAVILIIAGYVLGRLTSTIELADGSVSSLQGAFLKRSILSLFRNVSYGLMPLILVHELTEKKERYYLYLGTSILIVSGLIYTAFCAFPLGSLGDAEEVVLQALRMKSITMVLSSGGFLSFAIGFRNIRGVKRRKDQSVDDHDSPIDDDRDVCPECEQPGMDIYPDGSVHCENCGYSTQSPLSDDGSGSSK